MFESLKKTAYRSAVDSGIGSQRVNRNDALRVSRLGVVRATGYGLSGRIDL